MMEDKKNLSELPKGWVWTRLGEIGEISSGGTPSTKEKDNFEGIIPWLTPADLSGYNKKFISKGKRNITEKGLKSSSAVILPAGTILFSSRAPIGYVAIAKNEVTTNQGFKNLTLYKEVSNKYVYYYLKGNKDLAERYASGTTFLEISRSKFVQLPIPLPPLPEQHRIVAKIEELFTKLDAAIDALKKVKTQLKRYRQAVLKYAFEGKLTEEWRETHKGKLEPASVLLEKIKEENKEKSGKKYKELPSLNTENLPELPDGWVWTKLESCVEILDHKRVPVNADEREKRISGKSASALYPYYGATGQIGWIDDYLFNEELVLLGEDGAPFFEPYKEKAYIIRNKSWVNNHAHVLRAIKDVTINSFLCHYLNIFDYHGYVSGTTRHKLNQSPMRKIPIPIPPLPEQHKIVEEIERRFSVADEVEKAVEESLKKAERLRRSILKKAFEGKLVPQDPTDEPASVLLERIKKEKERLENEKKTKKKKSFK